MKMGFVNHLILLLCEKMKAGAAGQNGRLAEEARYAATGQSLLEDERIGMCSLLRPNWMFLVCVRVIKMPSLQN